jgi:hypothetical protein
MTTVRRIIAAAAVAGTLAVLPLSAITTNSQYAGGGVGFGTDSGTVTTNGGQGNWPLKN